VFVAGVRARPAFHPDPGCDVWWCVGQGFMRLKRSKECGVDKRPQDGTGCDGGPSEVTVCGSCAILVRAAARKITMDT
jgi:hypothetical protein